MFVIYKKYPSISNGTYGGAFEFIFYAFSEGNEKRGIEKTKQ